MRHLHRDFRFGFGHGRMLRKKIWAHLLVVLVLGIFASSFVFFSGWRSAFIHSAAGKLTRHVAATVSRDLYRPDETRRTLSHIAEELDIEVTLRSLDDQVIDVVGQPFPPLPPDDLASVRRGELVLSRGPRFFAAAPVIVDGSVRAIVEASPNYHVLHAPLIWRPLATLLVLMMIAGVASGPLARRISLPIERMTEAVRRFGAGDLSARVGVLPRRHPHRRHRPHAPDEIEQLTGAFNEMAERIQRLVSGQKELLANVSHELRSPLARMRVALELLPRNAGNQTRLQDVEADLIELDRLIEDVLTTSRLEASGLPMHIGTVDVRQLLEQLVTRAEHDPATTGKKVTARGGEGLMISADGALLKRALWNLIENAAKYGAPPIELEARRDRDQWLELSVTDHGAGIAEEDRERIFEPFFRSDKARTPGTGFGLGLTLVRRIAEVHGGSITALPLERDGAPPGCGFILRIPLG
jgi:two-component system, OmpR family, sensor kinase